MMQKELEKHTRGNFNTTENFFVGWMPNLKHQEVLKVRKNCTFFYSINSLSS